jgi:two-component system, sensor histidine kinase and response regulator
MTATADIKLQPKALVAKSSDQGLASELRPARILVVDDQPANIQVIGSMLGSLGHEIVPASDGVIALKRIAMRVPDLILLDLLMPGMDGFEVCRRIKANPDWQEIPIIFLSAADDKELIVRALNSGGIDFITKPFSHAELLCRVRTQLTFKATRDRLAQIAEDKDELIGILAHDLKNCLGGMNMSAELLHRQVMRYEDRRLTNLSENLLHTSAQSLAFVKEYLANAASDQGFVPKLDATSLTDAAGRVVWRYQEAAHRKQLQIETDFAENDSTVMADFSALDQVLDNLLSNALKFSPPGKRIFVSVRPVDGWIECVVQDEGPGFTEADKALMFRRYGRLSARPTAGEPSTGLGLSIVRKLVQLMNGELTCESSEGRGTTFSFRLPRPAKKYNEKGQCYGLLSG